MTLQKLGFRPRIIGDGPNTILVYVPWLVSLPFVGALGAYFSSRARASRATVLLASVFPVLALTAAVLLMFPIDMVVERVIGNHVDFSIVATDLLKEGIGWLLVPGAALLAGGVRSEEHTSELQSRLHLVCRLLLEKKKRAIISGLTQSKHRCWTRNPL